MNILEILNIDLEDVTGGYEYEKFYGVVLKGMKGEETSDEVFKRKNEKLLHLFYLVGKMLLYEGKLCVPSNTITTVMQLAHDSKTARHFGYLETLSSLKKYH